jgi:hypothetical protein
MSAAIGAALAFAFDPVSGDLRRARVRRGSQLALARSHHTWTTATDAFKSGLSRARLGRGPILALKRRLA